MTDVAIIGLGTMGPGIAAVMARAGINVRCHDINPEAVSTARESLPAIAGVLDRLAMPQAAAGSDVTFVDSLEEAVAGADMVLENVPERLDLKLEIFRQIDAAVSRDCIIASDTSGIPITKLQAVVSAPERVVGMHWSNPPHIIPMIEVIAGEQTGAQTTQWMVETIKSLNLLPVVVKKDVAGFVENRILYAIMREALDLVERGVIDAEALDTCVSWGIGYKLAVVGPMALLDMAGLDIYQAVGGYLNAELCNREDVSAYITKRTADGNLGLKTGAGMFEYGDGDAQSLRMERAKRFVAVRRALEEAGG